MTKLPLLLLFALSALAQAAQQPIRFYTHNLPPYTRQLQDGSLRGTVADVVRCALDRSHLPYRIEVVPWARAQTALRDRQVAGFFPGARSDEREAQGIASKAIGHYTFAWFLPAGKLADPESPAFRSIARVGTFHGSILLRHLQQNGYRIAANPNDLDSLVLMLQTGRVDAILAHAEATEEILTRRGVKSQYRRSDLSEQDTYLYFNRSFTAQHPDFVQRFNSALPECRRLDTGHKQNP